jgi:hypothetical protein
MEDVAGGQPGGEGAFGLVSRWRDVLKGGAGRSKKGVRGRCGSPEAGFPGHQVTGGMVRRGHTILGGGHADRGGRQSPVASRAGRRRIWPERERESG